MKTILNDMRKVFALVLLTGVLAILLFTTKADGQSQASPAQPQATPTPTQPAQQTDDEPIDDGGEVVRVESNLVVVPVSVMDAASQPVQGLTATDFRLLEEERGQEITQVGSPEQVPLEIAILLDVSGSVDARFSFEQQAASRFLKQVLRAHDRATVYAIDQKPRHEATLGTAEIASAKIMSIVPAKGPTAFYDSVVEASHYLAKNTPERHRRVVVVISDGEDTYSNRVRDIELALYKVTKSDEPIKEDAKKRKERLENQRNAVHLKAQGEVLREVQRADVVFYSINPSGQSLRLNKISQRAQEGMQKLADETGGTAFAPNKLEDLENVFRQIAAELRAQYLLQYYSTDESPSGKYLRLKVSVPARPQVRVRARQGYYVKRK